MFEFNLRKRLFCATLFFTLVMAMTFYLSVMIYGAEVDDIPKGKGTAEGFIEVPVEFEFDATGIKSIPDTDPPKPEPPVAAEVDKAAGYITILTGFEDAWPAGLWTRSGVPTWDDESYRHRTGSWAGWCAGSTLTPPGPYANNMSAWMKYGPFDLSDATSALMTFYYMNKSEFNYDWFGWFKSGDIAMTGFEVSGTSSGWPTTWQQVNLDLLNLCGDSSVWVIFRFRSDSSGVYEGAWVDDIFIKKYVTTPVLNTFYINNGAATTANQNVTLNFIATNRPNQYAASESSTGPWVWKALASPPPGAGPHSFAVPFTLGSACGPHIVYLKVKNSMGESNMKSDSIRLAKAPVFLYFVINGGEAATESQAVSLCYIVGCQPTHWKAAETTAALASAPWYLNWPDPTVPFLAGLLDKTLSDGYGIKTVYMQFKNAYGSSAILSDTILLLGPFLAPAGKPDKDALAQNYPNPFNPATWIPYQLKNGSDVVISIYSASGQLVRTLDLGYKKAGFYTSMNSAAYWDGRDDFGGRVASGVYFYTIKAGDFTATRKMLVTN